MHGPMKIASLLAWSRRRIAVCAVSAVFVSLELVGCTGSAGRPTTSPTVPSPRGTPSAPSTPSPTTPTATTQPFPRVRLKLFANDLGSPVALVPAPDATGRLFVVEQTGLIRILTSSGKLLPRPFLDLRDRIAELQPSYDERGLLGLAFHPDYRTNGRFFVFYSAKPRPGAPFWALSTSRLSEFRVSQGDPNVADAKSERILLQFNKADISHAGGTVAFGPDGDLYLGLGDSGGTQDQGIDHPPMGNGQDTSTLPGSILRIDVDGKRPYSIPPDNPFAHTGTSARPEIFAYGFRNPYRFSFDSKDRLFAADVGQDLFEEVDLVTKGGNYGWRIREGTHCVDLGHPQLTKDDCPRTGSDGSRLIDPIIEYSHQEVGVAIIGGFVYRGREIPGLRGAYVFGDWSRSGVNALGEAAGPLQATLLAARDPGSPGAMWPWQKLDVVGGIPHYLLGLGQDGELYALTRDEVGPSGTSGRIYRIVPAT